MVPENTLPSTIDLTKANALNRIPKPKDGDTGRDLYIEPTIEAGNEDETSATNSQKAKEKPPKNPKFYTLKEWNDELQGKTFVDEGIEWTIYEVYKDKNRLVVDYYDSKYENRSVQFINQLTKEYSYLKEVLEMSRNEDWFKPIYNLYLNPTKKK